MDIWDFPPDIAAIFAKPRDERTTQDSFLVLEWIERPEPVAAEGQEGEKPRIAARGHPDRAIHHRPRKEYVLSPVRSIQPDDIEDDWSAYTQGRVDRVVDPRIHATRFHRAVTNYVPNRKGGRRFSSWLKFCFGRFANEREKRRNLREEEQWPDNGGLGFDPPDDRSDSNRCDLGTDSKRDRLYADLWCVVGTLPERDRRAIEAAHFDNQEDSGIAGLGTGVRRQQGEMVSRVSLELGVSHSHAAVILHRARRRIRDGLIRRGWSEDSIFGS